MIYLLNSDEFVPINPERISYLTNITKFLNDNIHF